MSRNAAFHEVWGRTAFAGESAPVVELYGVGSLSATVCRGRIHGRTTGYGATYAFSLRPLSGVLRPYRADREGQQRVGLTHSARPSAMAAICAERSLQMT